MNLYFFIFLLFFLQFLYWLIGNKCSKNLSSQEDYFLAGKNVRFFPLMMTFLATQVGGGLVLGAAEEAYQFGWPVLLYPLGASLGLILLGSGLGARMTTHNVSTVAQIIEIQYKSKSLKKIASLLSILSLFMILVAQIIASKKFLLSLGFTNEILFLLFWTIVIVYTVQGGLKAVISTDLIQAAFFSCIFLFSLAFVLCTKPSMPDLFQQIDSCSLLFPKLTGWLFMPLLFMIIEQDMGQRCFSGTNPKIVSKAAIVAGIITMIVCIVPIFFGVLAKEMKLSVTPGESILMGVIEEVTNPILSAFLGCAILAAVISTATSLINAISSNIASDFSFSFVKKKKELLFVKAITVLIASTSLIFAHAFANIVDILIQSYELSVSSLFVPIIFALFKKEGNFISALLAITFGALSFSIFRWIPSPVPREIISILLSFSGFYIGEIVSMYQKRKCVAENY